MSTVYLLIHGFTGNPDNLKTLDDFLTGEGLDTINVRVKGHTNHRRDLRGITCYEWIDSVLDVYDNALKTYDDAVVIGYSMGGLIALIIGAVRKPKTVFSVCSPVFPLSRRNMFKRIVESTKIRSTLPFQDYYGVLRRMPVSAIGNFSRLRAISKKIFPSVKVPAVVIQTKNDDSSNPKSGRYIYRKIGSARKYLIEPPYGYHGVFEADNQYNADTLELILRYIKKLDKQS